MSKNPRREIRFFPDPNSLARISTNPDAASFEPDIVGLVSNESYSGCNLIVLAGNSLSVGSRCKAAIANLDPVDAEVRWIKEIDEGVLRLGLNLFGKTSNG